MYHPQIVARKRAEVERLFDRALPHGLGGYTPEESAARAADLSQLLDKRGHLTRPLTPSEQEFITVERLRSKIDFRYWARYCTINIEGVGKGPLYPLWRSQELILDELARREKEIQDTGYPDGLFINILKARQLGASTLSEALMAHRITTHANFHVVIAADVPDTSTNLFDMLERTVDHLPWYLRPRITDQVKNDEIAFSTDSWAAVLAAKSTRGTEGKRGQMGRGFTYGGFHLTELSTFEGAGQLDDAFLPSVAHHPQTIGIMESTAKGRGHNWWYVHWQASKRGRVDRPFQCVFIPWYAEPEKYWLPAPTGWIPSDDTLSHAKRAEEQGPYWMHAPVRLSREQLYWYEHTKLAALEKDELAKFLEEYPADDDEAFQYSGKSVFSLDVRERIRRQMRPLLQVIDVRPAKELMEDARATTIDFPVELTPGMGLRQVPQRLWKPLTADFEAPVFFDRLLVFQAPERRARYVVSVDVAAGAGQDRSVVEVTRVGDLRNPPEEVAQFVSSTIDPTDLAYVCAAVGTYYKDNVGTPAMMAIECNGFGLQTQAELLRHHQYTNFFVWQYEDAADSKGRFSRKLGWWTSPRTRPLIIGRFVRAVRTVDEITSTPDYKINSPHTYLELQSFQIPEDGALWDAMAGPGSHDDCLIAASIGCHVEQTLYHESIEPLPDHRRRLEEERTRAALQAARAGRPARDFINTDCTAEEMASGAYDPDDPDDNLHI